MTVSQATNYMQERPFRPWKQAIVTDVPIPDYNTLQWRSPALTEIRETTITGVKSKAYVVTNLFI